MFSLTYEILNKACALQILRFCLVENENVEGITSNTLKQFRLFKTSNLDLKKKIIHDAWNLS